MTKAILVISSFLLFASVSCVVYLLLIGLIGRVSRDREMILSIYRQVDGTLPPYRRAFQAIIGYLTMMNRRLKLYGYPTWISAHIQASAVPWANDAYELLAFSEIAFVLVLVLFYILFLFLFQVSNLGLTLIIACLAAAVPQYLVISAASERLLKINRKLPYALDLMILCMEAGSTFLEAVETLTSSDSESPLSQEFSQTLQEIQHGKTRRDALQDMAKRVKSEDLIPIVQGINTGEELGTPIGMALRIQAEGLRLKRTQRAEKLAGQASSKILFPSLLIMMSVLVILLGPVLIKAIKEGWL